MKFAIFSVAFAVSTVFCSAALAGIEDTTQNKEQGAEKAAEKARGYLMSMQIAPAKPLRGRSFAQNYAALVMQSQAAARLMPPQAVQNINNYVPTNHNSPSGVLPGETVYQYYTRLALTSGAVLSSKAMH